MLYTQAVTFIQNFIVSYMHNNLRLKLSKYNLNKNYDVYIFKYNRSGNLKIILLQDTNLIKNES